MARDWSRHTDGPILCPIMLRALARVSELGGVVFVDNGRLLVSAKPGTPSDEPRLATATAELLRHEKEAVELLERWSREDRPAGPSGEQ